MSTEVYRITDGWQRRAGIRATEYLPAEVPAAARRINAELHEAAGLPAPLILDRVPESTFTGSIHIDGRGRILLDPPGPLSPEGARRFASALAAAAERGEAEPDPAEVEALAEVLHEARERCGGAGEWDRNAARAILSRYKLTERE